MFQQSNKKGGIAVRQRGAQQRLRHTRLHSVDLGQLGTRLSYLTIQTIASISSCMHAALGAAAIVAHPSKSPALPASPAGAQISTAQQKPECCRTCAALPHRLRGCTCLLTCLDQDRSAVGGASAMGAASSGPKPDAAGSGAAARSASARPPGGTALIRPPSPSDSPSPSHGSIHSFRLC